MPIYEFKCPSGTVTERFVRMGTKEIKCPKCHKKAKKIISDCFFELKGSGWYADGYSHEKERKGAKKKRIKISRHQDNTATLHRRDYSEDSGKFS